MPNHMWAGLLQLSISCSAQYTNHSGDGDDGDESNKYSAHYLPGIVLSDLPLLIHLILMTTF